MELRDRAVSRPLAGYLFHHDKRRVVRVLQETIAGGVTVDDAMPRTA